ncbi:hypothetical protein CATRI_09025 [Corynebacterium atrinae]|uniref:hypothetical protein n=1 Tax=Corynebacterium atrinae TaxID=1336740 RepID=UPI0025B2EBE4|nr:hypothetical protein [Corynebacterium atrinae]WJY63877.1 hypothetical protein CATRI_09025 [Corynebacterium atrinae]
MGMEFKMSQEYFNEFDPERFAAQIKAKAAEEEAAKEAAKEAGITGTEDFDEA